MHLVHWVGHLGFKWWGICQRWLHPRYAALRAQKDAARWRAQYERLHADFHRVLENVWAGKPPLDGVQE